MRSSLAEWSEFPTAYAATVATVLGSMPASSDTVDSEGLKGYFYILGNA